MIERIISGGQTGVDRAALDVALSLGISYGGWCPKGRIDEYGIIPTQYNQLREIEGNFNADQENFDTRSIMNITDSDGTLILVPQIPLPSHINDGTLLTIENVCSQNKPYCLLELIKPQKELFIKFQDWVRKNHISVLNIAGPRESTSPNIYNKSFAFLKFLFTHLN